jgi:hypothetical protein
LLWVVVGVLTSSEEEEEGNDAEVTLGFLHGIWVGRCLLSEEFEDRDREGELGGWWWILSVIGFKELRDPVGPRFALRSSQEWRFSSQLEGLGDG